jgi:hypothetical protein
MRWMGQAACIEIRNVRTILVGIPKCAGSLGRYKCCWEDSSKMYLKEVG